MLDIFAEAVEQAIGRAGGGCAFVFLGAVASEIVVFRRTFTCY
jgi:hypothetical protein